MHIHKIIDPRQPIDRVRRIDLVRFARAKGVSEIDPQMPAVLIRDILKMKGYDDIECIQQTLGRAPSAKKPESSEPKIVEVNANADLLKQWETQKASTPSFEEMTIGQLRSECKRRSLKARPSDKKPVLIEKLRGQNTSERGQ